MRKILTLIGAVLLSLTGLTARADVSGTGQLTAYCYYWVPGSGWEAYGDLQLEVNGTYQTNWKSLNIMAFNIPGHTSYTNSLILTLDPATGNVSRTDCEAYRYYQSADYPAYYADFTDNELTAPHVITGKLENTGVNESTLTLSTWSDLQCKDGGKTNQYFNQGKWENTKVVFPFAIPDLPAFGGSDPEPEPEPAGKVNVMTANYSKPDGSLREYQNVTGVYDAQNRTLTLNNVANKSQCPLVLDVDDEGKLVSKPRQRSLYEDDLEFYYSDVNKKDNKVYGTVENGDKTATVRLDAFGDYLPDWDWFYSEWYNTVIVLDHRIEFAGGTVDPDPDPEPEPGEYLKCVLTSVEYQNSTLKFSDDNILGVGTGLAPNGDSSYGGYFKLRWTPGISQYGTNKDGVYYYILPANIDPETKEITLRTIDMNSPRDNHIKFDFRNGSYKVYEGLYNASSNDDPGSLIENSCLVIASYYDNERKDFKRIERAFYLKGGEFKGDTDGNMPNLTSYGSITFEQGKNYQWELLLDEIDLSPAPVQGETITGIFKAKKTADNPFEFSADNPLGLKFRLKATRKGSYGDYYKIRWTADSQYDSNPKDGVYYYVLPGTVNPATGEVTVNNIDVFANHIGFDYDSREVFEGLYKAASHTDKGAPMDNSCIVIASYYKSGMTDFKKIEKAYYLKGGEFKGDANGNIPAIIQKYGDNDIDYKDGVEYQWEFVLEEIPLGETEEDDYVKGSGNFKSLYTQESGAREELSTATVDGVYNKGKLRVDRMPTSIPDSRAYCSEIIFDVDVENGTATATGQTVFELLNNGVYVPAYFATYPQMSKTVTGDFVNIGGGKCQLTLPDWCEMFYSSTINGIYWAQTKIVFNFEVAGLKNGTEAKDPEVSYVPTVNYMTANIGSESGASKLYEPVKGEYNETAGTITLVNVAGKGDTCPLNLIVDVEGKLVSRGNEASSHEYDSEGVAIYYSDISKMDSKVYGTVTNNTDGTCSITLDPWGDFIPDFEDFANGQKWYNTYIVLDLSIPGLPNYKEDNGEQPDPGVQSGSVEGEWQFELDDIYKSARKTENWTATLSDGQLHFSGNANYPDFYAEYYSDGRVVIPNERIFVGVGGSQDFDLYQSAFDNYNAASSEYETKNPVVAAFDSSKDVITFITSPRQGIIWYACKNGNEVGGFDMLAFIKGTHVSASETEPSILLNVDEINCQPTDFFADVYVPIHTTGLPMDTRISLTYSLDGGDAVTKDVVTGNNRISFMGLKPGTDYEITFIAESGDMKTESVTYTFRTTGESSGVDSVSADNEEVRYFNLQGIEIFNPAPGTICIRVVGEKAERVMVR